MRKSNSEQGGLIEETATQTATQSTNNEKAPHGINRKGLFFMEPAWRLELQTC